MKIVLVAGSFDDAGGKQSGWARKLWQNLSVYKNRGVEIEYFNGGSWDDLQECYSHLPDTGAVIWLADVPNDKPKLVKNIKERHPKLLLITSKRNLDGAYSFQDLVSRALAIKANLSMEITGSRECIQTTILDPLGNVFLHKEANITTVAEVLLARIIVLSRVARVGSKQVGPKIEVPKEDNILKFLKLVKEQADVFHTIIHGVDTTRMLGNASFRCARGFPSFRQEETIFVSQRNVDKRFIGPEAFVAVRTGLTGVEYFGETKPSVDTPVQLALYKMYPKINFMLHSHTYIEGAPFTKDVLPCGATEEIIQIMDVANNLNMTDFSVNIKGHGAIAFGQDADYIASVKWIPRPIPELQ